MYTATEARTKANKKKSEFLGENYSTSCARLRKSLLFSLIKELKRDICFRCGERIENIADLSMDHKQPWLGVSKELFWDLNNLAFSHLKCNTPDRHFNAVKTHCSYGHPYDEENTYVDRRGYRHCIICKNRYTRDYMRRVRGK